MRTSPLAVSALGALVLAGCTGAPVITTSAPQPPAPVSAAPIDLTKPPTLGPPPTLRLPPITTRQLPIGLTLVVVEQHELPVMDVILEMRTGGEADAAGHEGLAAFTAAMLTEGTTSRSALEIADQAAYLGVRVGAASGWEQSTVALHASTAQLDSALALFADVVLHPAFTAADLERVRKVRLTALQQQRDRGPAIADRAYASALFGDQHPYGRPLSGTEASIAALSVGDLRTFFDTYYRPNNATLLVVGDVKPEDVERRALALFGGWDRRPVPAPLNVAEAAPTTTTLILVDKPGAAQSSFRLGGIGAPRSTRDYFALQVLNTVLGGSYTSRLNQNLRETRGFTYGANSGFAMRRLPGPFTASAEIVSAKSDSALGEFLKELRAIRDTVPADELARAKRYLQLGLPANFETTGDIARQMLPLITYGVPLDFYDSAVERIGAVSQADVQRVARQYVDPDRLTIVIVGDRKTIEPGLRALRPGQVIVRDVRDVLGAPPAP